MQARGINMKSMMDNENKRRRGGERMMEDKKPWMGKSIPVGRLATFMSQKGYTEDQIMEICIFVLGEFTDKVEEKSD